MILLTDIMQTFSKMYSECGDHLITDNYRLDEGTYILVSEDGTIRQEDVLEISKKNYDEVNAGKFVEKDYLSKLLDMNKPIDKSKTIHSNNYFSFWIKKNNIKEKLNKETIEEYYNILLYPRLKYLKSELYDMVENDIGVPDKYIIEKNRDWILENIFSLLDINHINYDNSYLKIYFDADIKQYEKENKRYMLPNVYNSADYNIKINDIIFGMPNNNMGLNSKKPYLMNKSRKVSTPYLISQDEVLMQKKLFDYLYNYANDGKTNIYVDDKVIDAVSDTYLLDRAFSGNFLRLKKGKEVEIHDYDNIVFYSPELNNFELKQVITVNSVFNYLDKENLNYGKIYKISDLQNFINALFFNKFLVNNYFTDPKDIRLNDSVIKEELIKCRIGYFNWFYKGNINVIKSLFEKSSLRLIKNSVSNGYNPKALEQFNLREAILDYFGGERRMAERLDSVYEELREKLKGKEINSLINDDEYYFALGQITYYLLSKNRSASKKQSLINPIINCSNYEILLQKIKALYKKYNYDIEFSQLSLKFNYLYSMILRYIPENKKVNDDILLAGFLSKNIIYEKEGEK
mgnify:CR=1 FL=1